MCIVHGIHNIHTNETNPEFYPNLNKYEKGKLTITLLPAEFNPKKYSTEKTNTKLCTIFRRIIFTEIQRYVLKATSAINEILV